MVDSKIISAVTPKILHVVISMTVGGAEKLVYDMARHNSFSEHKPVVCCLDELGELGTSFKNKDIRFMPRIVKAVLTGVSSPG